jgi:DNA-binding Xre family transcriptional regulator
MTGILFVFAMVYLEFLSRIGYGGFQIFVCEEARRKAMISYKRLWHLLLDKDLKKKDLIPLARISSYTISKLNRGDNLTTDVLQRICTALNCDLPDIMEFEPDAPTTQDDTKESK